MAASGGLVAIGSKGRESWLWDFKVNRLRAIKNPDNVLAVAISPDNRMLATAGTDKLISLWDIASGRQLKALSGHTDDVRMLSFAAGSSRLVSISDDKLVMIWDLRSGTYQQILRGHTNDVVHLAVSRDGQRVLSGDGKLVIMWDGQKGQELRRYQVEKRAGLLGMTPDGRLLVLVNGKELSTYRLE